MPANSAYFGSIPGRAADECRRCALFSARRGQSQRGLMTALSPHFRPPSTQNGGSQNRTTGSAPRGRMGSYPQLRALVTSFSEVMPGGFVACLMTSFESRVFHPAKRVPMVCQEGNSDMSIAAAKPLMPRRCVCSSGSACCVETVLNQLSMLPSMKMLCCVT